MLFFITNLQEQIRFDEKMMCAKLLKSLMRSQYLASDNKIDIEHMSKIFTDNIFHLLSQK